MSNTKHVELNATQDVQSVGSVGDYISRQAAIAELNGEIRLVKQKDIDAVVEDLEERIRRLREMPPADVVEVVRCKDCKYSSPNKVYGCRLERYDFNDESVGMHGEDFCSYGERKTDG